MSNALLPLEVFNSILEGSKERAKEWLRGESNIKGKTRAEDHRVLNTVLILKSVDGAQLYGGDIEYAIRLGEIRVERKGNYGGIYFEDEFHLLAIFANGIDPNEWVLVGNHKLSRPMKEIYCTAIENLKEGSSEEVWRIYYDKDEKEYSPDYIVLK